MSEPINLDGLNYATGWVHDPVAVAELVAQTGVGPVAAVGLKAWDGKSTINLGRYMDKAHGANQWILNQGTCGSCVAFGAALACDVLLAVDKVEAGADLPGRTDPMTIYGGSRVQIGKGRLMGQGSVGAWAAAWLKQYGILLQKRYAAADLTTYSASVCCGQYGRQGCPEGLFAEARQHPVTDFAQAQTRQDVGDAIANGHPVTVASNQGFAKVRDSRGMARAQGTWGHQMCIIGVREDAALIANSWGADWISGPLVDGQADGTFWADWDVVVRRMLAAGDSWVLAGITGWAPRKLNFLGLDFS